jgi:serine/threonine-protein kinase
MKRGQTIGKYTVASELGHRVPPTFAAHASTIGGDPELVLLECIHPADAPAEANDSFVKRARRLAQVRHPNVGRIRDVVVGKTVIAIVSDFIEGETLAELLALDAASETKRVGLPELLRVLVDVLSGMSAIHLAPELAGGTGKKDPPPFHGAIHPRNIVVGADGSARLIRVVRAPLASSDASERAIEEPGYAAPELLLGDGTAGPRVDIYSVGVLLWEVLSGKRLFPELTAKEVVARQLAGALPRATPPADMAWAEALVEIAARALEVDPDKRFSSTAELAGSLRLAVQARLAPATRVGNALTALAKEKIAERRARLQKAPRAATKPKIEVPKVAPAKIEVTKKAAPIANPPKIAEQKPIVAVPSLLEDDAADLVIGEDDAIDSKWSSVPPAKKPSMAPPLKKASIAPPPPLPPPPPMIIAPAPTSSNQMAANENLETIARVFTPAAIEMPGASVAAMPQADASGAVLLSPSEDPQRRRRMIVVVGMVAFAALILLVLGIRHLTSSSEVPIAAASASRPAQDLPTATATTVMTAAPTATTTTSAPPLAATSTPPKIDSTPKASSTAAPHDWASHPTPPVKPTHKKPPHSSYEPEGI